MIGDCPVDLRKTGIGRAWGQAVLIQEAAHGDGNEDRGNTPGQGPENLARSPFAGEAVVNHGSNDCHAAEDDNYFKEHSLVAS